MSDLSILGHHHKYQNYTKPTKTSIKFILIPRFGIYDIYLRFIKPNVSIGTFYHKFP